MQQYLRYYLPVFFTFVSLSAVAGQTDTARIPRVFVMGDETESYREQLSSEYNVMLLAVFNYKMEEAGAKVVEFISSIEDYATQVDYNIKGIRFYFDAYIDREGTVRHIAYHLKPESRNVDTRALTSFLASFAEKRAFPLTKPVSQKFRHSGSAYFPFFKGQR